MKKVSFLLLALSLFFFSCVKSNEILEESAGLETGPNALTSSSLSTLQGTIVGERGQVYVTDDGWSTYENIGYVFSGTSGSTSPFITKNDILKVSSNNPNMQLLVSFGLKKAVYTDDGWQTGTIKTTVKGMLIAIY